MQEAAGQLLTSGTQERFPEKEYELGLRDQGVPPATAA